MSIIRTVTGDLLPESLRFCHCHEHLMISKGTSYYINKALWIDSYGKTLRELSAFAEAGGTTVVDAQPIGCNRMAQTLPGLSRDSGVQIIASTGFHKRIFYPQNHWIFQYDQAVLAELFIHELQKGMYIGCDTAIPRHVTTARAGIVKCALDLCGLDSHYRKLFDAAVDAAKLTGAPVMVHIEPGSDPLMLAQYLSNRGLPPDRLIFCHMDRACPDIAIHKELCRQGIYLEYDTIARPKYHDDRHEATIFMDMLRSGYEDRLLFSLDSTRERLRTYHPQGPGLTYILSTFIPLLESLGCTRRQINKISCQNCRNILTISDTYTSRKETFL